MESLSDDMWDCIESRFKEGRPYTVTLLAASLLPAASEHVTRR